jgi:hypothetical protein
VAYTPPVIDPSGQSFGQLKTHGFTGHVRTLVGGLTTNPASQAAKVRVDLLLSTNAHEPIERARYLVDNYLTGKADKASTLTALYDLHLACASLAAGIGEIATLIDAN